MPSQDLVQTTHVVRCQPSFVVHMILLLPSEEELKKKKAETSGTRTTEFTHLEQAYPRSKAR